MNDSIEEKKEGPEGAVDRGQRIDEAEAAFGRGDFREARQKAQALLAQDTQGSVANRALAILDRTGVDPVFVYVFIAAAMILAAVVAYYVL